MKKLLVMDARNYSDTLDEIRRVAVRGIIFVEGRLLLVESCFGEVKFPGGGKEGSESDEETLIREVREETGFSVIPETIRPFGEVEEKRLSVREEMIWHQFNRYYFCDVEKTAADCAYTESEKKYDFHRVFLTLEEAIEKNEAMIAAEGEQAWNRREYTVLKLIGDHLNRH